MTRQGVMMGRQRNALSPVAALVFHRSLFKPAGDGTNRAGWNVGGEAFARTGVSNSASLPRSIMPEDVPAGSELWLERDGTEPLIEL